MSLLVLATILVVVLVLVVGPWRGLTARRRLGRERATILVLVLVLVVVRNRAPAADKGDDNE